MEVSGQLHALSALSQEKEPSLPIDNRLVESWSLSQYFGVEKNHLYLVRIKTTIP
jgi:hypothetical protein